MQYNVEINISLSEVEYIGRNKAIERADRHAWMQAINYGFPLRSIRLIRTETEERKPSDEYGLPGLFALRRRYVFEVD